jgi:DNA (cytosine-5)-methyltransferase 1
LSVDVFCGAGGLSQGLELAGHEVILAADKEQHMRSTYIHNHPNTEVLDTDFSDPYDIDNFIEAANSKLRGRTLRLLPGGPPCQGYSTAGKWNLSDSRNILIFSMLRLVKHLQPENVIIENVTGIRYMNGGKPLEAVIEHLEALDYHCHWYQLCAEQFGVPQRRRRVFILANRDGNTIEPPSPTFSKLVRGVPTKSTKDLLFPISVSDAISDLPPLEPAEGHHIGKYEPSWMKSHYQKLLRSHITYDEFLAYQSKES